MGKAKSEIFADDIVEKHKGISRVASAPFFLGSAALAYLGYDNSTPVAYLASFLAASSGITVLYFGRPSPKYSTKKMGKEPVDLEKRFR